MLKYFRDRKRMGYMVGVILLGLVIFAFIAFYIPDFLAPAGARSRASRAYGSPRNSSGNVTVFKSRSIEPNSVSSTRLS